MIKKINELEIVDIQNTILDYDSFVSQNNDTNITLKLLRPSNYIRIIVDISTEVKSAQTQIFFKAKDNNFTEENSIKFNTNRVQVKYVYFNNPITHIRLDAINLDGKFDINYFELTKISKYEYKFNKHVIFKILKSNLILNKLFPPFSLRRKFIKNFFDRKKNLSLLSDNHLDVISKEEFTNKSKIELQTFLASNELIDFSSLTPVVSIVLVLYNKSELTYKCLRSIKENVKCEIQLIIIT